ncbi:uncharacterized protein LOC122312638 [Carya illinoinensis]|uniref:uncharacterized protein LOC122312638 n=1 Tax=Carya illinoinensis TaxID=32201 RepID=UPI001C71F0A2|nr:uncharacterized protein LOC122312638 [Carya illinoinensis]
MTMIMRNIWHRRNKYVFEKKLLSPASVVQIALLGYEDYKLAQECVRGEMDKKATKQTMKEGNGWRKPKDSMLKANFDAATCESSRRLGIGVVIRGGEGEVYAAKCAVKVFNGCMFAAECFALWEAMVLCEDLGLGNVQFEGDAKGVIDAVRRGDKDDSSAGHLVEALQQKINSFFKWNVSFIRTEGNEVAHQLAKMALNYEEDRYWVEEGPEEIVNQVVIDKMYDVTETV